MKFSIVALTLALATGTLAGDPSTLSNKTYTLYQAWDAGRMLWHYTFNVTSVSDSTPLKVAPTVPIYKFVLNASDDPHNTTQLSLIDFIPGDAGYSDLWQIVKVVVPQGLAVVKSIDQLNLLVTNKTATLYPTQIYVNCPVVGATSTLENPKDAEFVTGYYKGVNASWFDFGPNPNGNATAPLYHVNTPNGIVELTDTVPGDAGYSAFWNIFTYDASNSNVNFTSVTQLSNPTYAKTLANCPVTKVGPAVANGTTTTPSASPKSSAAVTLFPSGLLTVAVMMVLGATLGL
ncbi:hypothetical protein BC936DRAFT_141851 [Jimgerdemannia flammicorona]|uniref:Uncharacterized protein n=1 Tax=Jimgerdemannia flammicorona TaxID=994334 RepID=A0A433A1I2_9FUNG|nr:hypothetical protein BC936DRAFT_141851 [Jimgerdemannia flammicorona]